MGFREASDFPNGSGSTGSRGGAVSRCAPKSGHCPRSARATRPPPPDQVEGTYWAQGAAHCDCHPRLQARDGKQVRPKTRAALLC